MCVIAKTKCGRSGLRSLPRCSIIRIDNGLLTLLCIASSTETWIEVAWLERGLSHNVFRGHFNSPFKLHMSIFLIYGCETWGSSNGLIEVGSMLKIIAAHIVIAVILFERFPNSYSPSTIVFQIKNFILSQKR